MSVFIPEKSCGENNTVSRTRGKMSMKRKAATRPGNMKSGEFQRELERDSGFSDANSEYLSTMDTTDSEDSPMVDNPQTPGAQGGTPQPSPLAVVGGSYSRPMIIMNNVLLKQPGDTPPDLKPWRFSPSVEVGQAVVQQPQVVFLQPVMSRRTPSKSKDHTSSSSARHRRSKKYLPILKSYPKIAPRDGGSSSGRGTGSSSSSSSSTSSEWSSQRDHSQKVQKRHHNGIASPALPLSTVSPLLQTQLSQLPSTEATNFGLARDSQVASPRLPELPAPSPVCFELKKEALSDPETLSAEQPDGENDGEMRRKRFCNTYNILRKSGLLDITLRTKELLWQNKRTQGDLERLKEQTDLFLQALRSRDASICVKLQASLREEEEEKERQRERREVKSDEA